MLFRRSRFHTTDGAGNHPVHRRDRQPALTVFPNAGCAVALIDRLTHHAEIISIDVESYRKRETKAEAVITPPPIASTSVQIYAALHEQQQSRTAAYDNCTGGDSGLSPEEEAGIEAGLDSYRQGRVVDAKRAREIVDAALGR